MNKHCVLEISLFNPTNFISISIVHKHLYFTGNLLKFVINQEKNQSLLLQIKLFVIVCFIET